MTGVCAYHNTILYFQNMSRTQRDNIFNQACFERQVWQQAVMVMNAYERGELKDQKLNRKQLMP